MLDGFALGLGAAEGGQVQELLAAFGDEVGPQARGALRLVCVGLNAGGVMAVCGVGCV